MAASNQKSSRVRAATRLRGRDSLTTGTLWCPALAVGARIA
jgi:hypothetical protein